MEPSNIKGVEVVSLQIVGGNDSRPANILVRRDEQGNILVFVTDFGIGGLAARQMIHMETKHRSIRNQTLSTAIRGAYTPLYASPQQVQGEQPDPRDDVHALGVIWYQLITGDLKLLTIPPDWRDVVQEHGLGKRSTEALASCLASRLEKRLASAAELADRLTGIKHNVDSNRQKARRGSDQGRSVENDYEQPSRDAKPNTENNVNRENEIWAKLQANATMLTPRSVQEVNFRPEKRTSHPIINDVMRCVIPVAAALGLVGGVFLIIRFFLVVYNPVICR